MPGCANNSLGVKTMVGVEVLVLNGNGCLNDFFRDFGEFYRGAVLVSVDFIKKFALSVKDFG